MFLFDRVTRCPGWFLIRNVPLYEHEHAIMTPRPYQSNAISAIQAAWKDYRKLLLVLPTAGGKTCVFSWLAAAEQGRTLILAHRDELIDQAIDKLHKATGIFAEKEKAEFAASLSAKVVVASVQTMRRRLEKWPVDHFSLVIADECHHCLSDEWQTVLQHFSPAKVLGCTATPNLSNKKNLGHYFEHLAYEVPLFDLIHQGFLSRIFVKALPIKIDLSSVKIVSGDYEADGLGNALTPYLLEIAKGIATEAKGRRTLAFLPLRATSRLFASACESIGLRARHIDGESPDRKEILAAFANDEFDVLSNSALLFEGYDDPGIDCVVMLRPTRSHTLYCQAIGRATRIAPMKENCLILDFLWLTSKHNLVRPAHLVAPTEEIAELMTERMTEAAGDGEELDLEGLSSSAQHEREKKLREELERQAKKKAFCADAMEFCLSVGNLAAAEWEDTMPWHSRPASEKQLALIQGAGIAPESIKSRGHASAVIDLIQSRRALKLATPKQVKLLRRLGHAAPESATFEQAGAFIASRKRRYSREGVAA